MNIPDNLRYTSDHAWILIDGEIATVGITDHAQEELADVVFVELPEDGRTCAAGDSVAIVESVKTASDIYCPVAGEIIAVNTDLEADPSLVNTAPYEKGWIFKIRVDDPAAIEGLMDASEYTDLIG